MIHRLPPWWPLLLALLLSLLLLGCDSGPEPPEDGGSDADAGQDGDVDGEAGDAEADADGGGDADGEDVPCEPFAPGMSITADIDLCAGVTEVAPGPGEAAIQVLADHVTVTCHGTEIVGTSGFGSVDEPTVGILIEGQDGATIRGCTVRGFRYGVVARNAADVTLEEMHLDDNFTDPDADWVQDTVQGGGIRLEEVEGARVSNSTFARNWNGIELRHSRGAVVTDNVADHCSNVGALLADAHDNELTGNDMSWAIRGELDFPEPGAPEPWVPDPLNDEWYSIDTKDSAGIIIDAGSSGNRIVGNDFTYGGDGVFIRSIIGRCAMDNWIEGNDTSYSPHNAIECWCDGNVFVDNTASYSNYGIWLGGSDRIVVRGNRVENNEVDGISIQIGEHRHSVIEDNRIVNNRRVGVILTGREYQEWDGDLVGYWADRLANSSNIVFQRNTLEGNGTGARSNYGRWDWDPDPIRWDVLVTATRHLVLASNCTDDDGQPLLYTGRDADDLEDVVVELGSCGGADGRSAPEAVLAEVPAPAPGETVTLDATESVPAVAGDSLSYLWLVQRAGMRFPSLVMPPVLLAGDQGAGPEVTFVEPGLYDVDLAVHDGHLAGLAWRQVGVVPEGVRVGESPSDWTYECDTDPSCVTTIDSTPDGLDGDSVHILTDAPFPFAAIAPASRDLGLDASTMTRLSFFIAAENNNELSGWQGRFPIVVLASPAGTITYAPEDNLLPTHPGEWIYVDIPLAGGEGWSRSDSGGSLSSVDWIEIQTDTWGWQPYQLWIDALTLS